MNSPSLKIASLIALIVWLAFIVAAVALAFGLYVVTQIQPLNTTPDPLGETMQESNGTGQGTEPGVTQPTETEIKNDTDLQNTFNELDTTNLDELDALLDQNDLDAANF